MNTNVNELNLNEMEMITGGDFWNHVIGAVTGMGVGALVGGLVGGAVSSGMGAPVGMMIGYYIVAAEPAVQVLKKQVEEISNGRMTQRSIGVGLSVGVAVSVGIAMLRILTGISLLWFLIPGYAISLIISFFVPPLYTGVAFDAGGVASGPMTTAFLLPFAAGACEAIGGNLLTDAFGIVAMVAMTPLITIQALGFKSVMAVRHRDQVAMRRILAAADDQIIYFE